MRDSAGLSLSASRGFQLLKGSAVSAAQRRIRRHHVAAAGRAEEIRRDGLGLRGGAAEGDQRKAWQSHAEDDRASASARCWTRHHYKNTPTTSYT
jgi:hypothetical protein